MTEEIKSNLDNPQKLEWLYRNNKNGFKKAFEIIYPENQDKTIARCWYERLTFEQKGISWGAKNELILTIVLSFLAGLVAKIPAFTGLDEESFYPRNIAFIVLPFLVIYFAWKESLSLKSIITVASLMIVSAFYINILPVNTKSDTLILACIHLPIFIWGILGFTYAGGTTKNYPGSIDFLRFNGDLIVLSTVLMIAGGLLSAATIGLFQLIQLNIEEFYFSHIAIWGAAAAPVVGTYLVKSNPQLVKNVSPVIAKVFTPLVLIMLLIYLMAIIYTGKDPYNDREFLLIFNLLLIGVMAIILFSLSETARESTGALSIWLLFILSLVTIVLNGIALSAILFRISEWGITPNRLAVLGSNVLIILNLIMVAHGLFKSLKHPDQLETIENVIARFLPVYWVWTLLMVFVFPVLFGFK